MRYFVTPRRNPKPASLLTLLGILALAPSALASDCSSSEAVQAVQTRISDYEAKKAAATSDSDRQVYERLRADAVRDKAAAITACENQTRRDVNNRVSEAQCAEKQAQYARANPNSRPMYTFRGGKCVDLSQEVRNITDSDECNNASIFTELKGKNCKKALDTIKSVQSRNSAITQATTAGTQAYSGYQAMQATGAQDDAQLRQANIMKGAAAAKFLSGAANLAGAMQLQGAASGAEAANSTITEAQKNLAQACKNAVDEQQCFYQNATKFGISSDAASYANFERMKRGASQSHDQAEAAKALAKQSMITGAADMLVGLQAMRAAQLAQQNAQQMAPPPMLPMAPPAVHKFGSAQGMASPSLAPATPTGPVDYGNPSDGETFGAINRGRVEGSLMKGGGGIPNVFKSASSQVSGGGGGGSASGGRGRGSPPRRGGGPRNTALGEIKHAGAVGFKGGSGGAGDPAGNPLADMLSKMFPQGENGKAVVDPRQLASPDGGQYLEEEQAEEGVEPSDLTLFEQVTAKYRQLDGSGRF